MNHVFPHQMIYCLGSKQEHIYSPKKMVLEISNRMIQPAVNSNEDIMTGNVIKNRGVLWDSSLRNNSRSYSIIYVMRYLSFFRSVVINVTAQNIKKIQSLQ